MERYNEYKDSGVYFIPDIPKSWQVLKAKYLFKQEKREVRPEDEIVTCFRDGQVTLRKNRRTEGFTNSMKEIGYQGVRKGDLVIHNMDAFAGAIGVSDSDGKGTPVYACCTPKRNDINQYYYCYLLRYLARNGFILSLAKGIRERSTDFRFNDFKELYLPVPSKEEQDAIVSYIDLQSTKIDKAIAQQQKMIDLLNERKQIIINNAVTKGLNPDAPMKDSGVDWIGKIPEYWMTRRMRYLCKIKTGDKDTINRVDEGKYPFYVRSPKVERINSYTFDGEAVLMAGDGVGAGKVFHYVNGKFGCHQRVYIFHDIKNINGEYLYFYMKSLFKHTIEQLSAKSTVDSVRLNMIQDFIVAIPTNEEQTSILSYLHKQIEKFDVAIANATKQISLLQERKQIIINDVVTGKVKVS